MPNYDTESSSKQASNAVLFTVLILILVAIVVALCSVKWETVKGNELGIKETFSGGVENTVLMPKTYSMWRGFADIIQYDASSQVYELDDYKVQSAEGQDLIFKINLRWRIDPERLVAIHTKVRDKIDKKLIEPSVMRIVKDEATRLPATAAYSGTNLVTLQSTIQADLINPQGELRSRGVIVELFVIKHIDLDPKYIEEIKQKQIATQRQLRAVEEQKAADAEALVAKAKAQSDLNKVVVEAQRDKETTVLKAQAEQEKAILAAKGEQQKSILEAEGKMQAAISEAKGILALGEAKANAQKLQLMAYAVPGAEAFVRTEIAKSLAEGTRNIQGYLPEGMTVNLLADNFMKAVETILRPAGTSQKTAEATPREALNAVAQK